MNSELYDITVILFIFIFGFILIFICFGYISYYILTLSVSNKNGKPDNVRLLFGGIILKIYEKFIGPGELTLIYLELFIGFKNCWGCCEANKKFCESWAYVGLFISPCIEFLSNLLYFPLLIDFYYYMF